MVPKNSIKPTFYSCLDFHACALQVLNENILPPFHAFHDLLPANEVKQRHTSSYHTKHIYENIYFKIALRQSISKELALEQTYFFFKQSAKKIAFKPNISTTTKFNTLNIKKML